MNNDLHVGDRIRLKAMDDAYDPVPPGTTGTVNSITRFNTDVEWDNGRTLALIPEIDKFEVIERKAVLTLGDVDCAS